MAGTTGSARALYIIVGIGLVAAVLVVHVLPAAAEGALLVGAAFDVAHVFGFAALTAVLVVILARKAAVLGLPSAKVPLVGLAAMAGLAVLAEAAQYPTARDASLGDLLRDFSGILAGFLIVRSVRADVGRRLLTTAAGVVVLVAGVLRPASVLVARTMIRNDAGVQFAFENPLERILIETASATAEVIEAPASWQSGGHVLRVEPRARRRSEGISLRGLPPDLSQYSELSFRVASVRAEGIDLTLRIDSPSTRRSRGGRFRWPFRAGALPREIELSVTEIAKLSENTLLDLSEADSIAVLVEDRSGSAFLIDDLRLVRER